MATKVMALEWAEYGIRVNCVAPGATDTHLYRATFAVLPENEAEVRKQQAAERIPMKRIGQPSELANAILFLASGGASYVTGQSFAVDGGSLLC